MEKKTPTDPMPMGVQTGGTNKAVTLLTHGLTSANPMPRKKKTPTDRQLKPMGAGENGRKRSVNPLIHTLLPKNLAQSVVDSSK